MAQNKDDVVVHPTPVWRERANFIIAARIDDPRPSQSWRWEQLWARQIEENRFEICCIPFFLYDLALGDEVTTQTTEGKQYVISEILKQSGHYTFRVWFHDPTARETVGDELAELGCLTESRGPDSKLLAVDAGSEDLAKAASGLLLQREATGKLQYETGRTK